MIHFVTGKLGAGKTLVAVGLIRDRLAKGLPVATNLDIYTDKFKDIYNDKVRITRIPDKPSDTDLYNLGNANETYDEDQNGLLVLDECGTWFNSRNWSDKGRKNVIDWFLHARKLGWDIVFIVQDISLVDKQAREALAEHTVFCRRLDRLKIPFIGNVWKLITGKQLRLPKIHRGKVHYGDSEQALVVDVWNYLGRDLYKLYDTKQCFSDSENGNYCVLTPWHMVGRYQPKMTLSEYLNLYLVPIIKAVCYPVYLSCEIILPACKGGNIIKYDRSSQALNYDKRNYIVLSDSDVMTAIYYPCRNDAKR